MRICIIILSIILCLILFEVNGQNQIGILTPQQIIELQNVPEIDIPNYKKKSLPLKVNNAKSKFFPGLIIQEGNSCSQVSGISYVFTYEMNCKYDRDASLSENRFNFLYTYNFLNKGFSNQGASYLDSWKIIQENGHPTVIEFSVSESTNRWMNGYDRYKKSMQNRIDEIYSIKLNTEEGILKLKNWLYNHLGQSEHGGLACFYAGLEKDDFLADGTPEAGEYVYTELNSYPLHAWAIVGYNDEIRYDYNNDGIYTNDIDINGDNIVNVQDWEIGGLILYNTYTTGSSPNGQSYCMYKALANKQEDGAPFNNLSHIIKIKDNYTPKLSLKTKLKHSERNKIKLAVGYSENIDSEKATSIRDFHSFNFQGGNYPMQGKDLDDEIEIGIDVTQFYHQNISGDQMKVFLYIIENDPNNLFYGEVLYAKLLNYENDSVISETANNVELTNNDTTIISFLLKTNENSKLIIEDHNFSTVTALKYFEHYVYVNGGIPLYSWEILPQLNYSAQVLTNIENITYTNKLNFDGNVYNMEEVELPFEFPFFANNYNTIYITSNGTILFDEVFFMDIYMNFHEESLSNHEAIVPLGYHSMYINSNDYVMYEIDNESISLFWKLSHMYGDTTQRYIFETKLYKSGNIDFKYDNLSLAGTNWIAGISNGEGNYLLSPYSNFNFIPDSIVIQLIKPEKDFDNISITKKGLVYGFFKNYGTNSVKLKVTDYTGTNDIKEFIYNTWPTSQNELSEESAPVIFPNPANDFININLSNDLNLEQIIIFNNIGQSVLKKEIKDLKNKSLLHLNIQDLKPGFYHLRLIKGNETSEYQFIKK